MSFFTKKSFLWAVFILIIVGCGYYGFFRIYQSHNQLHPEFIQAVDQLQKALDDVSDKSADVEKKEADHFPVVPEQEKFTTREAILKLFKDLGITYCGKTLIGYEQALDFNAKESEKYKNNKSFYDQLSDMYADDVSLETLAPIYLRWLGTQVGYGVFAQQAIKEGQFIGIYGGVVQNKETVKNKDYAWAYPTNTINDEPVDGIHLSLDARFAGNEMRFVNDGINPNCIVRYVIGHDNYWHVCYVALQNIAQDEQLLVSYGKAYWDTRTYKYQALADGQ